MRIRISILIIAILMIPGFPSQAQEWQFSGESAFEYLEKQCSFGPRNPGSPGHAACLEYLTSELRKFGANVVHQNFFHQDKKRDKTVQMYNIFAQFSRVRKNAQKILLVAHWDTRPMADRDPDPENRDTPILGANDGASGVAVLLELARIMHQNPPPVPVDILLTDGEDYGEEGNDEHYLLGARHFAKRPPREPYKFGILLDLVGDKDQRFPKELYSMDYLPDLVDRVWKRAAELGISTFDNVPGPRVLDDHLPLIEKGIPIINIIDFDYKYWHTLEDTPDKCSPKSLENVGILVESIVYDGLY